MAPLSSPQRLTRRLILQEARRQAERRITRFPGDTDPPSALRLLVSARFQVLFHSPNWGAFHLSLTVLVHYRSSSVFSLGEWAPRLPTGSACPVVLRIPTERRTAFAYGTGTLYGGLFDTLRLALRHPCAGPATPPRQAGTVWATPRSLATTSGMISFPLGTEMFQFPRFPPPGL